MANVLKEIALTIAKHAENNFGTRIHSVCIRRDIQGLDYIRVKNVARISRIHSISNDTCAYTAVFVQFFTYFSELFVIG